MPKFGQERIISLTPGIKSRSAASYFSHSGMRIYFIIFRLYSGAESFLISYAAVDAIIKIREPYCDRAAAEEKYRLALLETQPHTLEKDIAYADNILMDEKECGTDVSEKDCDAVCQQARYKSFADGEEIYEHARCRQKENCRGESTHVGNSGKAAVEQYCSNG